jgi:hypothetical protein
MKRYKYLFLALIPMVLAASCKKSEFVQANINPSTLTSVDPGAQFLYASTHFPSDFENYYDYYRAIMPWMQYITNSAGNAPYFTDQGGNFNYRYANFYGNVGLTLADIPHLISNMTAAQQAQRIDENAIATIYKAEYAFYVSDVNGSIPYSQAFQGRYGGTLTPTYDTQENLFDSLDTEIKNAVSTLEATTESTQTLYGGNDPFYGGATDQAVAWEKAGNALRLKIAMRLIKRNPTGVASIVSSVLADANQMASNTDGWVLLVGPAFATESSNYNPTGFLASAPMVNFFNKYSDPREPIFFRQVTGGGYVGSPSDPDSCSLAYWQNLYKATDTPISQLQHRLFTPDFDENDGNGAGTGIGFYPVLTYAEYCFIRADLAFLGITTDNPSTWYNNGVTASIQFYDARATAAGIVGYTPVTATQISTYLAQPGITYNPTIGEQQIACQAYLDFFRQPSEGWAWWKRTGYPNTTTVLAWDPLTSSGTTNVPSRRVALTLLPTSDANYANQQAAYAQMATDPGFGSSPSDGLGRVWWDMQ